MLVSEQRVVRSATRAFVSEVLRDTQYRKDPTGLTPLWDALLKCGHSSFSVQTSREPGWLEGTLNGKRGLIPQNYVKLL